MVLSGASMPIPAIRSQIASAIDVIVHLGRLSDHSRRVLEISEIIGFDGDNIQLNPLFVRQKNSELIRTSNPFVNTKKADFAGISLTL